jgi:predicted ATPase/DNA-binding XRE family transcriptional regulator
MLASIRLCVHAFSVGHKGVQLDAPNDTSGGTTGLNPLFKPIYNPHLHLVAHTFSQNSGAACNAEASAMQSLSLDSFTTFGELLRYLRQREKLTQRELSIAVGYSESQINRLEKNLRLPETSIIAAQFVPALHLENEPQVAARLIELAAQARGEPVPASLNFTRATQRVATPHVATENGPPLRKRRDNLPASLTSFVGREREMDEIASLLRATRLLTLTGAGGVGKTRLAIEVASKVLDAFADGVWLIELAPVSDPALVTQVIIQTLRLTDQPNRTQQEALCDYFEDKHALLVVDNCEHVINAVAELIDVLLRHCPRLHVLTTSRETLRLAGETNYRVPSLTSSGEGAPSLDAASRLESVRLFEARAQAQQPGWRLTEANVAAVVRLCAHLDGIPLALELAAALVQTLSVEAMAARLDDRLALPSSGFRAAMPRHQTMRNALGWSYDLLTPDEQRALARLSVFAGGWTLDAARVVAEADLPVLDQLVRKSLVLADAHGAEMRYRLLEPIRQYAEEMLARRGELDAMKARHAAHMVAVAEAARVELLGPNAVAWMQRLEADNANLQAAILWSLQSHQPTFALRIGQGVFRFWHRRGMWREALDWLEQALTMDETSSPHAPLDIRAKAARAAGVMAHVLGQYDRADRYFQTSLALASQLEDNEQIAATYVGLGVLRKDQGRFDDALSFFDQAIPLEPEHALKFPWQSKADMLRRLGRFDEAEALFQQALALNRRNGDDEGLAHTLRGLGEIAYRRGDTESAEKYIRENEVLCRKLNHERGLSWTAHHYGDIARVRGDWREAAERYADALTQMNQLGDRYGACEVLTDCAQLAVLTGHYDLAARWLGMARAGFDALGAKLTPYKESLIADTLNTYAQHLDGQTMQRATNDGAQDWRDGDITRVVDALQTMF